MTGIIRVPDRQGRLHVPKEALTAVGIGPGDRVEVWSDVDEQGNPALVLKKHNPRCVLCNGELFMGEFKPFKGKNVCVECLAVIKAEQGEQIGQKEE